MKKIQITAAALLLIILGISTATGDIVLKIEDQWFYPGSTGNTVQLILDNPDDAVAAIQVDILFDTDCFSVTDVNKTDRSNIKEILNYSNISNGIRIAMTGLGHDIGPGYGPIAEIIVNTSHYCDGQYVWDMTGSVAVDPLGDEIDITEVDGHIDLFHCDPLISLSDSEFDFGDICIGQAGIGTLYVSNVGCGYAPVVIATEGCATADPTSFEIEQSGTQTVIVYCRPEVEGQCIGALLIQGFGYDEVTVTCNGVMPAGTKGDVNEDGEINVLDAVKTVNYILGLVVLPGPEAMWAADCNGPYGKCDGDTLVNVLDVIKIVNLILELDECFPQNVIYFNSFESAADTTGWYGITDDMFVDDPAPQGGSKSLYIVGGCVQPQAFIELPQQSEDGYYTLSCWGKDAGTWTGKVVLTCSTFSVFENEVELYIADDTWTLYQSDNSLYCPADSTLKIGIEIGGDIPERMYIDCIKVEKVE